MLEVWICFDLWYARPQTSFACHEHHLLVMSIVTLSPSSLSRLETIFWLFEKAVW